VGGTLNLATDDDMTDWDMRVNGQTANNAQGLRLAYNSLLAFQAKPLPDANYLDTTLIPELAEKWEVSPDAKTFTFHLQKGVKWADGAPLNGRELSSADVKWSYEYASSTGEFKDLPPGQNSYMWDGLAGIDTPDPYTVVVKFKEGFAPFINYAASNLNPIYAPELKKLDGGLTTNILGTGPYQWDQANTQKGSRWVFTKNATSFQADQTYINEVRYIVIKEEATRQAAFKAKQVDSYSSTDAKSGEEVLRANPDAPSIEYTGGPRYLLLNFARPPLDNMKVRLAISRAIDRDAFIKVQGGKGEWGLAGTNLRADLFTQEEIKQINRFDIADGKKLMAEAGFANGAEAAFMYDNSSSSDQTLVPLLQSQLKQIGIDMKLDGRTRTEVGADRKTGDFQMHWFGEYGAPDPDYSIFGYYSPGQRLNYTKVNDPKMTQMALAQRQEADPVKRRELLRQAVKYLNETALGIGIDRTAGLMMWQPYLKNFAPSWDWAAGRSTMIGLWIDR
jgi:peptide/nickel transport system substrate-binding protein